MKPIDKTLASVFLLAAMTLAGISFFAGPVAGVLWAVAGTLVAAAAIVLVAGRAKVVADERGITLQTLIVTAVLVLMAGAAGVVIIAITNSAQDDSGKPITRTGQPMRKRGKIFDPTLEAAGRGGGTAGTGWYKFRNQWLCKGLLHRDHVAQTQHSSAADANSSKLVDEKGKPS